MAEKLTEFKHLDVKNTRLEVSKYFTPVWRMAEKLTEFKHLDVKNTRVEVSKYFTPV